MKSSSDVFESFDKYKGKPPKNAISEEGRDGLSFTFDFIIQGKAGIVFLQEDAD